MNYFENYDNPRWIESLYRSAIFGQYYYGKRAKSVEEALARLSAAILECESYSHLSCYRDDLELLKTEKSSPTSLEWLKRAVGASTTQETANSDLCSDAQWAMLKARGYKDTRPSKESVGRIIAEMKRK